MYAGQQPGGEAGVLRLLADHLGGRLDRQPVELGGGGAVVQAADRAGGDPHRVDARRGRRDQRSTARTILLTSTGSASPLRLRTCIGVRRGVAVSVGAACAGVVPTGVGDRHCSLLASGPGSGTRGGGRRRSASGAPTRRTALPAVGRPSRPRPPRTVCTVRWQVFGLAGTASARSRAVDPPTGRRFPDAARPVLYDGGRSHSPLRGSPGFSPGSLLPRPAWVDGPNQLQATPYTGPSDNPGHHMLRRRVGTLLPYGAPHAGTATAPARPADRGQGGGPPLPS